jgi:hypothetical protein
MSNLEHPPECRANVEDAAAREEINMSDVTIPESARPAIYRLAHLTAEDFATFLKALERAKPAASPDLFSKHITEQVPTIDASTVKLIVDELFSMNSAIEKWSIPTADFAQDVAEAAFSEQSDEFPVNETDKSILQDRLKQLFALKATLGLTAKALDVLTDAQHLFYTAKILTDARPVFNEAGTKIEAAVIIHNLMIHYGDGSDHRNFFVSLDTKDIKELREVLNRADAKDKAMRALLQRSETPYLDVEE